MVWALPAGTKKASPCLNRELAQAAFDVGVGQGFAKHFRRDARLQAEAKFRGGLRGNRIPHFRFSHAACGSFMLASVFVTGMDLHRELFGGEDEFYKERNVRAAFDAAPNPVGGKRSPSFAQGASP